MNEEMKDMFEELQEIKHKIEKMEHKFQKMGQRGGGNYGQRMGQMDGNMGYRQGGYNQGGQSMGQMGGVFWGQSPMMGGNQNSMMQGQYPMEGNFFDPRYM